MEVLNGRSRRSRVSNAACRVTVVGAAAVFAAVLGSPGCAVPEPPASSFGEQRFDDDVTDTPDGSGAEAEWLSTLEGTWLQYSQASNCVDVLGVAYEDQLQRTFYIVEVEQGPLGDLVETFTACDVELSAVLGLRPTVPEALLQTTWPVVARGGLSSGSLRVGEIYQSGPIAELWGIALDDPLHDPVPTPDDGPDDPRIVDKDGDGNPGSTLVFPGSCDAYIAQRTSTTLSGVMVAPDRIEGGIPLGHGLHNAVAYQYIVGATNSLCATRYILSPNVGRAQFERVRVDGRGNARNIDTDGDGRITCAEALPWRDPAAGLFSRMEVCPKACEPEYRATGTTVNDLCDPEAAE